MLTAEELEAIDHLADAIAVISKQDRFEAAGAMERKAMIAEEIQRSALAAQVNELRGLVSEADYRFASAEFGCHEKRCASMRDQGVVCNCGYVDFRDRLARALGGEPGASLNRPEG